MLNIHKACNCLQQSALNAGTKRKWGRALLQRLYQFQIPSTLYPYGAAERLMNKIINKRIYVKNLPLCWIPHPALCSLQLIWPTNIETENLLQNAIGERYQLSETKSRLILFSRSFPKRSFGGEYYAWCQEGRTEYARSMQGRGKMWVLWHVCLARLLRIPAGASQEEGRSSRLLHLPFRQ